jgi:ApaG protein
LIDATPFVQVTQGIRISVIPQYLPEQSNTEAHNYAFAYTVLITNERTDTVQLLRRHWYVFSGGELLTEVEGEGVVGAQPTLPPGESFKYASGTVIYDFVGAMVGHYTFLHSDGSNFNAEIPMFDLVTSMAIQ